MGGYIQTSQRSDWATPPHLFDVIVRDVWRRYGQKISLDVCAQSHNAKCAEFFDPSVDGLAQPWDRPGSWWFCNPPYGREIKAWVAKGVQGRGGIFLLPARTDVAWFHDHCWAVDRPRRGIEVEFLRGRVRFQGAEASAPFPSMLVWVHRLP